MPYSPGVQSRAGEFYAQGIASLGQGVGAGLKQWQQNKAIASQATGKFEATLVANPDLAQYLTDPNAPPEAAKAFAKLQKDGNLGMRDAALLAQFAETYSNEKQQKQLRDMREAQLRQIQQQEAQGNFLRQAGQFQDAPPVVGAGGVNRPGGPAMAAQGAPQQMGPASLGRFMQANPQGGGVRTPQSQQAMQDPMVQMAAQFQRATGQVPSAEVLANVMRTQGAQRPTVMSERDVAQRWPASEWDVTATPTGQPGMLAIKSVSRRSGNAPSETTAVRDTESIIAAELAAGKLSKDAVSNRRAELLANGGRAASEKNAAQPYQSGSPMADESGKFLGFTTFDQREGKYMLETPEGRIPLPKGARPTTATASQRHIPNIEDFRKLRGQLTDSKVSLDQLTKYLGNVEDANQGFELMADSFSTGFKTLLDSGKLTEEQLKAEIAAGQVQGLLGKNRQIVVGPGPMTEQDAARVVIRLGGSANALRNKEVVARAIADVYRERYMQYQDELDEYNSAVDAYYGSRGRRREDKIPNPFEKSAPPASGSSIEDRLKKY
jgi:hypothetical protein